MKTFAERNPVAIGIVGTCVVGAITVAALQYDKLPFINPSKQYSAYFAEAGGLRSGAAVQVSGFRVGTVSGISLDGPRVLVTFTIDKDVHLGERTEAAIKTKSLLGAKVLNVTSRGEGQLTQTIPVDRTQSPYQLPDALGDLAGTINGLDTKQVSESLATLSQTFQRTPPDLKIAIEGVARFSDTLDKRDTELRGLLANANKATAVLAQRSDQVVGLIRDTNALLAALQTQSSALNQISGHLSALAKQLSGFIADNRDALGPALDKLNGALTIVDNRKQQVQKSIKMVGEYIQHLGESVASGPFFKAYVANLMPGQFLQPFIDAAFSDLGLDPHTLPPSQLSDPATGQRGTPPLPMPYPRTGQGGEPRLTLPDAITGNPDDHQCGVPGVALPGPGCYPYREPLPAPPPGGPPPGPPAIAPPGMASTPDPGPTRVYVTAPNEIAPQDYPDTPAPSGRPR